MFTLFNPAKVAEAIENSLTIDPEAIFVDDLIAEMGCTRSVSSARKIIGASLVALGYKSFNRRIDGVQRRVWLKP